MTTTTQTPTTQTATAQAATTQTGSTRAGTAPLTFVRALTLDDPAELQRRLEAFLLIARHLPLPRESEETGPAA